MLSENIIELPFISKFISPNDIFPLSFSVEVNTLLYVPFFIVELSCISDEVSTVSISLVIELLFDSPVEVSFPKPYISFAFSSVIAVAEKRV